MYRNSKDGVGMAITDSGYIIHLLKEYNSMVFSIFRVEGASPNFVEHSHELNRYFPVVHTVKNLPAKQENQV